MPYQRPVENFCRSY